MFSANINNENFDILKDTVDNNEICRIMFIVWWLSKLNSSSLGVYMYPEGLFWLVWDHGRYVIVKISIQHVKISPLKRFGVRYLFKIRNLLIRYST